MVGKLNVIGFVAIFCNIYIALSIAQTLNDSKTLMEHMLQGYDRKHRPVLDQSRPLEVTATFSIVSVLEFEEVDGRFFVSGILSLTWMDEAITWNPASYGGISSQSYDLTDIWYPTLMMISFYDDVDDFVKDWMTVRVNYDGRATFAPGSVFRSKCIVDVTFYPFDTQICHLIFVTWDSPSTEILLSLNSSVKQNIFLENGEWTLEDTRTDTGEVPVTIDTNKSFILFEFKLKRKSRFYLLNILLPITILVFMNVFVFLLPPESGERISYAITVLLAITVFLTIVGDTLPKTSNPVALICYFLIVDLIISTVICVVAILNLRLYFKKTECNPPSCLVRFARLSQNYTAKQKKAKVRDNCEVDVQNSSNTSNFLADNDKLPNETEEKFKDVTWMDVGAAIDLLCMILFFLVVTIVTVFFLVVLVANVDVLSNRAESIYHSLLQKINM